MEETKTSNELPDEITIAYRIEQDQKDKKDYRKIAYTQSKRMYIKIVINTTDSIIKSVIHKHKDYEFIIPLAPIPCPTIYFVPHTVVSFNGFLDLMSAYTPASVA